MNFLNLSYWEIIGVDEQEERYVVQARPRYTLTACPTCGSSSIIEHGTDVRVARDLPAQGKQVSIHIKQRSEDEVIISQNSGNLNQKK